MRTNPVRNEATPGNEPLHRFAVHLEFCGYLVNGIVFFFKTCTSHHQHRNLSTPQDTILV
ncbi:MAG: hypothetical protein ABI234_14425 [Ktedonobacteraceae bacterium]